MEWKLALLVQVRTPSTSLKHQSQTYIEATASLFPPAANPRRGRGERCAARHIFFYRALGCGHAELKRSITLFCAQCAQESRELPRASVTKAIATQMPVRASPTTKQLAVIVVSLYLPLFVLSLPPSLLFYIAASVRKKGSGFRRS